MDDFLFRQDLVELDEDLEELLNIEAERQYRKLILIPSESTVPLAIRKTLSSAFHNIYAEGYPPESTRKLDDKEIFDYESRLSEYRRYSDPRYYKGVEYADLIEALARRRCAETFAANGFSPEDLFVNVQPLSGSPANNAVYHALLEPGAKIMGMDLLHGGHLSHGSPVHRSGKYYDVVSYSVDVETEKIDYDAVEVLAREHQPKLIIAGVSSYPWVIDWARFREIADAAGAYLLADIAHVAGLIAGGAYPSPVGHADVITSTTHKTLCGPRGAVIITTDQKLAKKLDRAVFPGEQGGPHVNVFAAMALAFKLTQTDQFRKLQDQIVKNCIALSGHLSERGIRIPYGGTNTHLTNIDMKSIVGKDGAVLNGDLASRILDIAGIVTNRNTIPGDKSARNPSGVRLGTPWVTQRGFTELEMVAIADLIADILDAVTPYYQDGATRAKVDFLILEGKKIQVRELATKGATDILISDRGYPHFYYLDDEQSGEWGTFTLKGDRVKEYINFVFSADIETLENGGSTATCLHTPKGTIEGALTRMSSNEYIFSVPSFGAGLASAWLRDLSDGYVKVDDDLYRKIPGPIVVKESSDEPVKLNCKEEPQLSPTRGSHKPYYIGVLDGEGEALPKFQWEESEQPLRRTPIYDLHVSLGAKMVPFAGWEMPVRYSSVLEEHLAVREAAGLFDVAHMGVYQVEGPDGVIFLNSVCGNDINTLSIGESLYTHFLNPNAHVIDDLLVYRRAEEEYLLVVNASNDD
ncbi:MAG: serine hydroxymethyltransferase, partial [Anaerolineales bacterium]